MSMFCPKTFQRFFIFIFVLIFTIPFNFAQAARILKVKGRKILIDREGDRLKKGDRLYIISNNGKVRGVLKVVKIKSGKALGRMSQKSKAQKGWTLSSNRPSKKGTRMKKGLRWGALLGANLYSVSVEIKGQNNNNTSDLSGIGPSFKALIDYPLISTVWIRGLLGYEQFTASEEKDKFCGTTNNKECSTNMNLVTVDLWARWLPFQKMAIQPWVGFGTKVIHPLSYETTAIDEESIGTMAAPIVGLGLDWPMGRITIPIQFDYTHYLTSEGLSTNTISFSLGVSF